MPSKNIIKTYLKNSYYHIYNRGVEKRKIFIDEQDYKVFLSYLKIYLTPKEESIKDILNIEDYSSSNFESKNKIITEIYTLNNFFEKIELIGYVLMPNHFHLELKQHGKKDIETFMRSLITKYSKYFNKKYNRVGPLFQSRYKAILIQSTEYLLYLSKYIHRNPQELFVKDQPLESYPWSSYPVYLKKFSISWLKMDFINNNFLENGNFSINLYKDFVEREIDQEELKNKAFNNLKIDN
ncbi:MAG: transposase [Patescibacteria group bacterium]